MASKRALQFLPLRTSSCLLRSQCLVARPSAPRAAAARRTNAEAAVPQIQQRWHSSIPEEKRSKEYDFEAVRQVIEDPADNTMLIDVREPHEHSQNSIPTSFNIPITSSPDALLLPADEFRDRFGFQKPPLQHPLVFFCKAGVRSSAAAQIARQGGYENVGEYRGSWNDWVRRGGMGTKGPAGAKGEGKGVGGEGARGGEAVVGGEVAGAGTRGGVRERVPDEKYADPGPGYSDAEPRPDPGFTGNK
ncbi:Rhodanese-like protein [Lophiostoma macrostomum CBS 122681]|uniref:Rhodanese-like protein n=1 Tax=Lophiostoma macrostomum CBS 122681 TaxID=1314788 RepID=A0A6A6TG60_9PLEO|nr:Rhodanese-like protein [Lophiostoma macrostomum CBS 122681]